ncbi:MAG TPA: hypothetical protein PLQ45_10870, partial [Anaerohalosphaeraceae bacterium]|nr:hypothetical protein [Anaerohalosphaeraceae bacterium]
SFLMGYVLLMDDKLTRAKIAAEYALDNMPDHPGAKILAEAVQNAQNSSSGEKATEIGIGGNP